jgi:hypothetical protein
MSEYIPGSTLRISVKGWPLESATYDITVDHLQVVG